jgi:hypothetical protein
MAGGWFARLEPRTVLIVLGGTTAVLAVMGTLYVAGAPVRGFDPNGEANFLSLYDAGLLWLAAVLAATVAGSVRPRAALLTLAAVFTFLGFDEFLAIHERLQDRTDVPSSVLLSPIALVGALTLFLAWRQLRDIPGVTALLAGGALAWAASQAIDGIQPHYQQHWSIVPEEALEMVGSTLFVLAFLVALRAADARARAHAEPLESAVSAS